MSIFPGYDKEIITAIQKKKNPKQPTTQKNPTSSVFLQFKLTCHCLKNNVFEETYVTVRWELAINGETREELYISTAFRTTESINTVHQNTLGYLRFF